VWYHLRDFVKGATTPWDDKSRVLELPRVLVRSEEGVGTIKRRSLLLLLLMAVMTACDGILVRDHGGDEDVVVMFV